MDEHDADALGTDDSAKLPDPDVLRHIGSIGDEEDHDRLVERVCHVQPEGVRLVDQAEPPLGVQFGVRAQDRIRSVLVQCSYVYELIEQINKVR